MSYCRFFEDSDVYAYECEGGVQFWTTKKEFDRLCNTFNEAYQYIKSLRDEHGLKVPNYAIKELKLEALEEAKRINGQGSAVDELARENAKLRELCGDMCDLLPHADWPSTKCDEKASACIEQAIELGIEVEQSDWGRD